MRNARLNAVKVITRRELATTVYGIGIYAGLTLSLLVAVFLIRNSLNAVAETGLAVFTNPLDGPFRWMICVVGVYLALCAAISVSRERDQGTLEVLFYGPVDSTSYVVAKYLEQMVVFLGALALGLLFFFGVSRATNLGLGLLWTKAVGSLLLVSCLVSLGLFLSAVTRRARTSIIAFLGVTSLFFVVDLASAIFSGLSNEMLSASLIWVRKGVTAINAGLLWVSPFGYFSSLAKAMELGDSHQVLAFSALSVGYTAILLYAAIYALRKKGVRQ